MSIQRGELLLATVLTAGVFSGASRAQLPEIAAPPNSGAALANPDAPIVERPPARVRMGPPRVACWAIPSNTAAYCGYYVGGGAWCHGEPSMIGEGTWGWDYHGCWVPQRVFLQWWHGRCRQGGVGAYRIEGPHLLHLLHHHGEGAGHGPP